MSTDPEPASESPVILYDTTLRDGTQGENITLSLADKIRVARCDVRGKVRGEWRSGTGRIAETQAEEDLAYAALHKKYGWQMRVLNFFSRRSGRIEERAILELEL